MKGVWSLPEGNSEPALRKLRTPHILRILTELKVRGDAGLSNAEIDSLLETSSQWLVFWDLRELMALGLIEYSVQLFGEPGKYRLTKEGVLALQRLEEK